VCVCLCVCLSVCVSVCVSVRVLVVWFKALDSEEDMLQTAGLINTKNYASEDNPGTFWF